MRRSFIRSSGEPWRPSAENGETVKEESNEIVEDDFGDDEYVEDEYGRKRSRKRWHVSEKQLLQKIAQMAEDAEANSTQKLLPVGAPSRRARSVGSHNDDKIEVNIFFIESGDTLTLRVSPDLRLGPAQPPKANAFTELYGQGASTKGFQGLPKTFDCKRKEFGSTNRPGWSKPWSDSLKERIFRVTNIAIDRQRLTYRHVPMTIDDVTLQTFGVVDGEILTMRVPRLQKDSEGNGRNLTLACTKRKMEELARQNRQEEATKKPGNGVPSLRANPQLGKNRVGGDIRMMPRWISQDHPKLFVRVGIGLDELGNPKAPNEFGSSPIYLPDVHDRALRNVRDKVASNSPTSVASASPTRLLRPKRH